MMTKRPITSSRRKWLGEELEAWQGAGVISAEQRQAIVGKYGSPLGEFGEITFECEQLRLDMKTGQQIELLPRSPTEFDLRWTAAKLVFRLKDDGQAAGFTLHIGGDAIPISRKGGS